jgi:hypothetical protein
MVIFTLGLARLGAAADAWWGVVVAGLLAAAAGAGLA